MSQTCGRIITTLLHSCNLQFNAPLKTCDQFVEALLNKPEQRKQSLMIKKDKKCLQIVSTSIKDNL